MKSKRLFSSLISVLVIASMSLALVPSASAGQAPNENMQGGGGQFGYDPETGQLIFVGAPEGGVIASAGETGPMAFVNAYGAAFGLSDPANEITAQGSSEYGEDMVTRYQQVYQGVPVFGGNLVVTTSDSGGLVAMAGKVSSKLNVDVTPTITPEQAITAAQSVTLKTYEDTYNFNAGDLSFSEPVLWIYDEKLFTEPVFGPQLVWKVDVSTPQGTPVREVVLVNARLGKVALHYNKLDAQWAASGSKVSRTRARDDVTGLVGGTPLWSVYDNYNTWTDPDVAAAGAAACSETVACSTADADWQLRDARDYLLDTYDFYWGVNNRDSIDGAGMRLKSVVRYGGAFQGDVNDENWYFNAYWDGAKMVYGDGLAVDDVTAHELTHGVTDATSELIYIYQSGAINESLSDVWGELVDLSYPHDYYSEATTRWLMGEDILGPKYVFRSMKNPPAYGDPDKMTSSKYYKGPFDGGGVHTNSGVNNKAAYLMTDGGKFNGKVISGLGINKVGAIYYRAQTTMLFPSSNYLDLYYALNFSCNALIGGAEGITKTDCEQVKKATEAVEMNKRSEKVSGPVVNACPSTSLRGETLFSDNFESGLGNWSFSAAGDWSPITSSWKTVTSPDNIMNEGTSLWAPGPDGLSTGCTDWGCDLNGAEESAAFASSVSLPPGQKAYLTFDHMYMFDTGMYRGRMYYWDGGVLEYSTDGGTTWKDANPLFNAGVKYNGSLVPSQNPLGKRSAFVANSRGDVLSMRYNLSSLAGQNVKLRWRVGYDYYTSWGWFIDNVDIHTCIAGPAVPALLTPKKNELLTNYTPTLDWSDVPDVHHYVVQVATDTAFGYPLYNENTGTTSQYSIPSPLDPGTTYYWRVAARNSYGGDKGWSAPRPFRAIMTPPVLTLPADGVTWGTLRPEFDWDDVYGASGYTLQVSKSNVFKGILLTGTLKTATSQFTPTKDLPAGVPLYWHVRANGLTGPSQWSVTRTITLSDPGADDDGDGLPNVWETNGYDADGDGSIDVDLPALGAKSNHKDIFVEMDYMANNCGGTTFTNGLAPNATVMDAIVDVFAHAPVTNPDGVDGINIHLDLDDQVACDTDLNPVDAEFYALKAANFDPKRAAVYHYMIWAVGYEGGGSSGLSFGIPATDFIVTLGSWGIDQGTEEQKIGTFIHELGHNLNLTHGGTDHNNYKPNYLSIMNYFFQTSGLYHNGAWGDTNRLNFDYQRITVPALNEAALNETVGLGSAAAGYGTLHFCPLASDAWDRTVSLTNAPIDWNCDGDTTDTSVRVDINYSGGISSLASQNNWPAIVYNGGGIIGSGASPDQLLALAQSKPIIEWDELTWEMEQKIEQMRKSLP